MSGIVVGDGVVLIPLGGGLVALDAATGEERWQVEDALPPQVEDGLALVPPAPRSDDPYRLLDLDTGDEIRSLTPGAGAHGLVGSVLALGGQDGVRLEDARTGEAVGEVGGGDDPAPVPIRSAGGQAWLVGGDRFVTLRPGETTPVETPVPSELADEDLYLAAFLGDVDGGVVALPTDAGLRLVGRDGGLATQEGPDAVVIEAVVDDSLALQVGLGNEGPAPPVEVRPVR